MNTLKICWQRWSRLSQSLKYLSRLFILSSQSSEIVSSARSPMSTSMLDEKRITEMLRAWGAGEREASEELIRAVYKELRWRARHQLRGERDNHTLQTTALINE